MKDSSYIGPTCDHVWVRSEKNPRMRACGEVFSVHASGGNTHWTELSNRKRLHDTEIEQIAQANKCALWTAHRESQTNQLQIKGTSPQMRRRTNHLGQELRPDITLVRVHNHVPEDLHNVSASSQKTPAAKNFEKTRSQMSTLSLWVDPWWQGQPVHRVTDTLVGARLDDHSEDQEVYGVENGAASNGIACGRDNDDNCANDDNHTLSGAKVWCSLSTACDVWSHTRE